MFLDYFLNPKRWWSSKSKELRTYLEHIEERLEHCQKLLNMQKANKHNEQVFNDYIGLLSGYKEQMQKVTRKSYKVFETNLHELKYQVMSLERALE